MDTTEQIKDLQRQINELKTVVGILTNAADISPDVYLSLKERFAPLVASTKTASSENQAVNEGGTSSYNVLKAPDGFDERNDAGTIKYFPYYT